MTDPQFPDDLTLDAIRSRSHAGTAQAGLILLLVGVLFIIGARR